MPAYRILIVDDQKDIRHMLRLGIQNLGSDYQVLDMPSAEEALLELGRKPVDLLVTDIRLPGMSGLELTIKIRQRKPDQKIILVTALTDSKIRRQASEAKVDGFFNKPLDLPNLLEAIENCLGIVHVVPPPAPLLPKESIPEPFIPVSSIAERLASLRRDLSANATVLLDDGGQVIAQAGDLPELSQILPSLMAAFSASIRVSSCLGMQTPRSLIMISGVPSGLCMAHIGASYALLVLNTAGEDQFSTNAQAAIETAVEDLLLSLAKLDAPQVLKPMEPISPVNMPSQPAITPKPAEKLLEEAEAKGINQLFDELAQKNPPEDVDLYWETAVEHNEGNGLGNASVISYEQARKLGLAPKER
jgi:CheY-like chemotaxis protein